MMVDPEIYFLYPAELFASQKPYQINTILGSCVAVCFWDTVLKYGGMCHYMLPLWNGTGLASPKYGNIAIERLLEKMIAFGSNKINIVSKIFGGGEVIDVKNQHFYIGERNIELAIKMIKNHNIPIISSSTGGKLGRKIIFYTHTGEVKQRYVQRKITNFDDIK